MKRFSRFVYNYIRL